MMTEKIAYVGLGSNLGDRKKTIDTAVKLLNHTNGVEVLRTSKIIETTPLGLTDQGDYLNAVAEIKTSLAADDLHEKTKKIETSLGRIQTEKWTARTIDLDILLFGSEVIETIDLTIPHRQMHLRTFVLAGLTELKPDLTHPILTDTVKTIAARLNGNNFFLNPDSPQLICIAGLIGVGKTTLAEKLARILRCNFLREPYSKNPYLPKVYAGQRDLALDSQIYFLNNRVTQLDKTTLTAGQITITDYVFNKELIYAELGLNADQLAEYKKEYYQLADRIFPPVLVIYLTDSAENCLERIHNRNRPYEQQMQPKFLKTLKAHYENMFRKWEISPIITISPAQCTDDSSVEKLAEKIKYYTA